jgi:hypothetical protein
MNEPITTLAQELHRLAAKRLAFVMAHREKFLEAWVAEHGMLPSMCELHETTEGVKTTIVVRYRASDRKESVRTEEHILPEGWI